MKKIAIILSVILTIGLLTPLWADALTIEKNSIESDILETESESELEFELEESTNEQDVQEFDSDDWDATEESDEFEIDNTDEDVENVDEEFEESEDLLLAEEMNSDETFEFIGDGSASIEAEKMEADILEHGVLYPGGGEWTLYSNGYYEITGNGSGIYYAGSDDNRSEIKRVVIEGDFEYIDDNAFKDCIHLENIKIPEGIESIGDSAFSGCSDLCLVIISKGVTSIGDYAFYGCSSLGNINIPEGITSIGDRAFYYCESLKTIELPKTLESIGCDAFWKCENLVTLEVPSLQSWLNVRLEGYASHPLYYNNYNERGDIIIAGSVIRELVIPKGITDIGAYTFVGCNNISSLKLPESVKSIGEASFYACRSLSSVTLPKGLTSIGYEAFAGCSSLKSITIPESVTNIESGAFASCSSLKSITIPKSVKSIGEASFCECSSLSSVTLPKGLTGIEYYAFAGCSSLKSITIPESVTNIESGAFASCSSLKSITIPKSVTNIEYSIFAECTSLTSVTLPEGLLNINGCTFEGCSKLSSIKLPNSLERIGNCAFAKTSLTNVEIPAGVKIIEGGTFGYCKKLKKVTFVGDKPNFDNSIYESVFDKGQNVYFHGKLASWKKQKTGKDKYGVNWINMDNKTLATPKLEKTTNTAKGVEIQWKASDGANSYRVFRKNGSEWYKLGDTQALTFIDTKVKSGTSYTYTVRCLNDSCNGYVSKFDSKGISTLFLSKGVIKRFDNLSSGGLCITWDKVKGARGYVIYRHNGKEFKPIKTIKDGNTITYKDTAAKTNGQKYTYAVRPYSGNFKGAYVAKTYYRVATHTITSVSCNAPGTITVNWNKNNKATGYMIRCYEGSKLQAEVTISSKETTSTVIRSLKKGKTYSVYVRGYKNVDGVNYYSAWSAKKDYKVPNRLQQEISYDVKNNSTISLSSDSIPLNVKVKGKAKITYSSSDEKIIKVTKDGNLHFSGIKTLGTAKIIINVGKTEDYLAKTQTITITTKAGTPSILLNEGTSPNLEVKLDDGKKSLNLLGVKASNGAKLKYSSSDPSIAEVDGEGNITPQKAGTTEITVATDAVKSGKTVIWNKAEPLKISVTVTGQPTPTATPTPIPSSSSTISLYWPVRDDNKEVKAKELSRGYYKVGGSDDNHNGIDVYPAEGQKWYAAYEGEVYAIYTGCVIKGSSTKIADHVAAKCDPYRNGVQNHDENKVCNDGIGNGVVIKSTINGKVYYFRYCHMSSVNENLYIGKKVSRGDFLGNVGGTGRSTAVHAHFAISLGSEWNNEQNNTPYTFSKKTDKGTIITYQKCELFSYEY